MSSTIILFNPMPVKHSVATINKKTTSLQVPLVNVPLSLLALARMVMDDFDVKIINAVVDASYTDLILEACSDALCLGVSSMTCYQIRDWVECVSRRERTVSRPPCDLGRLPSNHSAGTDTCEP
ncbi:MAG TPA: hypothetical protein EYP67_08285 [Methanosarcinales archaeon]|nr:hypothetical protein [Methanosarcinales archaeon]